MHFSSIKRQVKNHFLGKVKEFGIQNSVDLFFVSANKILQLAFLKPVTVCQVVERAG